VQQKVRPARPGKKIVNKKKPKPTKSGPPAITKAEEKAPKKARGTGTGWEGTAGDKERGGRKLKVPSGKGPKGPRFSLKLPENLKKGGKARHGYVTREGLTHGKGG